MPAANIKVIVREGWLTLDGQVTWWFEKNEAETAVRALRGVKGISNNITIKPRVSAADVKAKIESAFQRHAVHDAKGIRVVVGEGSVTLEGEVHNWQERWDAETAAWAAPGVTKVIDHLAIRS